MSRQSCHCGGMKTIIRKFKSRFSTRQVAQFGSAKLITRRRGELELEGGSLSDRTDAKEWIAMFRQDEVLRLGS